MIAPMDDISLHLATPRAMELKRIQLRSRRLVTGDLLGQYHSAFRGTGLVFTDIREYQPGDDVKHIHWKATARTNKVFVKSYEEERQLRIILAVDVSASMRGVRHSAAFSKVVEFSATVGALAQRGNDLIGLSLFADTSLTFLPPKSGIKRNQEILASLLNVKSEGRSTDLAQGLHRISISSRKPSIVFVLSDFLCPPFEEELKTLARIHDVVLVQIESGLTLDASMGLVTYGDAESASQMVIDTSSSTVRSAWQERLARHRASLREIAQRCGADHITITDNPIRPLTRLMQERTRRISR